ncbi:MAG TPA: hypothetical protein VK403_06860, partial [Allosphingosinicella sp.]|nr:hypothetical protein [Allosphingosinicella sp.]
MKRMFPRARALGCALLALTACCGLAAGPAAAQGQNTPQAYATAPADHKLVTPNGVDLRSGRFDYRQTDLSIGAEGDSGLQLTRLPRGGIWGHVEPFANFTHNLDIMIAEKRVAISSGRYDHGFGEDYRMIVRFGSRSETFDGYSTGPHYEQISKSGTARLTYSGSAASASAIYTYEATDGTVATFRPIGGGDCSSNLRCAYVSQLVFVDGTLLSFDYEPAPGGANAARLRSVTSSRGYALLLEYGGGGGNSNMVSKACTINLAERARSAGNLCPAGVPASAYTYTMFNELVLASSTDAANATSAYQYGLAEGWGTIGFVKPGETSPWLTNFYGLHPDQDGVRDITVKQALANGQVYNVGLETSHAETEGQIDQFGSGDIVDAEGHTIKVRYGFPKFPRTLAPGYNPEIPNNFPEGGTRDPGSPPLYQMTSGPISVTDELDRTTTYDYCDPVIAAWLPAHETDRCVAGLLRSYTGPDLTRTEVTFDACRNVSGIRRHARPGSELPDLVVTATYDCLNPKARTRPLSVTDANGNITRYTYSTQHGGVLTETGPAVNGVTPQKRYSYVQRVARTADGSAAGPPVWLLDRMSYCRTGNPAAGGAGCELAGDEVVTTYDYGPAAGPGNLLLRGQAVSADGRTLRTCAAYDSQGRRTSETGANANLAACPAGAPTAASPYTSTTRFDAAGRVTGTIAPDPDGTGPLPAPAVRNGYDAAGRLTRVEQGALAAWQPESVEPKDWTGFTVHKAIDAEYDALDRKTREAASGAPAPGAAPVTGNVTEYSYDLDGRLKCTAVRMNPDEWATPLPDKCVPGPAHPVHGADRISKNVYDPAGQLTEAWDGVGTPLQRREALYTYDANGQRTSLTDARGFRAEMVHDGHGRQSRWIFPSKTAPGVANAPTETNAGDYEEYAHDLNGNRTSLRKRDGRVIGYEYDALNRVTVKDVPEFGLDVLYAYDLRNLQTGAWFTGTGRGVWTGYDGFGRPTSSTTTMGGVTRTIGAQYSRGGQRTEMTWPDGEKMSFAQDGLDRMKAVYQGALGSTFVLATFAYDPAARLQSLTRRPGDATAYGYDSVSRLKSIADTFTGGAGNVTSTFAYNPANQLRREERDNDAYAFTRQAGSRSYEANGLNQYTSVAGAAYTYDANGNLTSDGTTTFAY